VLEVLKGQKQKVDDVQGKIVTLSQQFSSDHDKLVNGKDSAAKAVQLAEADQLAIENKIAELAIEKNYNSVICGHIHQPEKRVITTDKGSVNYLNSGDWVEHLTALEYRDNDWHLYKHSE